MSEVRSRSTVAEIRARTAQNVTDIVSSPREYFRVQQVLRDREDLLHAYDMLAEQYAAYREVADASSNPGAKHET